MRQNAGHARIRKGPTTITTIFELILRNTVFQFWGDPRCRIKSSRQWNTEKTHRILSSDAPSIANLMRHQMLNNFGKSYLWMCLGRPRQKFGPPDKEAEDRPAMSRYKNKSQNLSCLCLGPFKEREREREELVQLGGDSQEPLVFEFRSFSPS